MAEDSNLSKMKAKTAGTTQRYKAQLRASVNAETFQQIQNTARLILRRLPDDVPLGTLTAALMLAGMAYAESAPHAAQLIADDDGGSKAP